MVLCFREVNGQEKRHNRQRINEIIEGDKEMSPVS